MTATAATTTTTTTCRLSDELTGISVSHFSQLDLGLCLGSDVDMDMDNNMKHHYPKGATFSAGAEVGAVRRCDPRQSKEQQQENVMKLFVLGPNEINAHILFGNCNALSHKSFATRMKLGINLLHFAMEQQRLRQRQRQRLEAAENERIKIYLGAVDKSNSTETGQQIVIVEAGSYVIHEEYNFINIVNDIALIKLPNDLEFNQYIQPAKLPEPNSLHVHKNAIVSGWGRVKGFVTTEHLQYTNVKTLSNEECKSMIPSDNKFYSHWLCVAPNEKRTCKGDSGGPLAERNPDGSSTVIGIVSFGFGPCLSNFPTVFTRVAYFLTWIAEHINEP
ncbi:serine proteinase stubble-like [Drosophila mojavensis]|uniref:serine proteinase stubble-like n=1 Tax=Drosophila mojavensis TaxID=7230 RepID=UPI001CD06C95|nr:serine proteinase stubble-like [Drosophila mojavensis]